MILEIIGYVGSVLIGLSLTMSNIKKLRWINLFGAAIFAIYGVLISAWPVLFLNGFIVLTDIWHLYRMSRRNEFYSLLPVQDKPSAYLKRFTEFHGQEIQTLFPHFSLSEGGIEGWWVLRDVQPVGLFLFHRNGQHTAVVDVDYVAPAFRDMKSARWFFSEGLAHLRDKGINALVARSDSPQHQRYLVNIGFRKESEGLYRRQIHAHG